MSRVATFALLLISTVSYAAEPFRYPEAKHGLGELKYVNHIPVLALAGTPDEMGEQMGVLGMKPAAGALTVFKALLARENLDKSLPLLKQFGEVMLARYPADYRREFDAIVKHSGLDRDMLVIGNSFSELRHLAGCSAVAVDAKRSSTGGPLFGRNWDFPSIPGMHQYQLVMVYRPTGKPAFAVIGFPGSVAASAQSSGFNAAGLVIGGNLITASADKAPQVDWLKTPSAVVARRVLEGSKTVAHAEAYVRKDRPAERHALAMCDATTGAVLEITPKTLVARRGDDGLTFATNHFEGPGLALPQTGLAACPRMNLFRGAMWNRKVTPEDVMKSLNAVCQREMTAHSFVFEPATLKLSLAFGDGKKSATDGPYRELDLKALFDAK